MYCPRLQLSSKRTRISLSLGEKDLRAVYTSWILKSTHEHCEFHKSDGCLVLQAETRHPGHYCLRLEIEKLQVPARHTTETLKYLCKY